MSEPETQALQASPFCTFLRTKKSTFAEAPAKTEDELLDGSGACWCLKTMLSVGPDTLLVDPAQCRTGRSCFEPIL